MTHLNHNISRRAFGWAAAGGLARWQLGHAQETPPPLPTLDDELRRALESPPLALQFTGHTRDDLTAWQARFATELRRRIGPHAPPQTWQPLLLSTAELADHTREEWLLQAEGVPSLPLYLLVPKPKREAPYPIVLALHGHGPFGHDAIVGIENTPEQAAAIRGANYDYGRQLVRAGYLVVAPCFTPFGRRLSPALRESKTDACAVAFVRLMFLGQTLLGANLRDVSWALDFASGRDDTRPDRVGCVGLSYGGRMTMMAAALDPRIKAAVISGALNVFQERARGSGYSCGAQVIPGLLEIGDTPEIGSLIAPRPCIWELGSRDGLIVAGWAEQAIARLERAYRASGQADQLQFHRFEGGHEWSGRTALAMLAQQLQA